MKQKTKITSYAWVFLGLLYFFLRYQNIPGVFSETGLVIPDTDPYYRLHRIVSMVGGLWSYPLFETKLNFPYGWNVAWPLGLDLIIAAPLKVLGVSDPFFVKAFSFLIIPILSIPIFILTGLIVYNLSRSAWLSIACVFFLIPMHTLLFQTNIGRLDHHFLEALFPLLFFWLWSKVKNSSSKKVSLWFSLALGLSLSFYPHAWLMFIMLLPLVYFSDSKTIAQMKKVFFHSFLISLVPLAMSHRFWNLYVDFPGFSWWGSLILLGCSFIVMLFSHIRERQKWNTVDSILSVFVAMILIGGMFAKGKDGVLAMIQGPFHWLYATTGTLEGTKESWSVFRFSFRELHDMYLMYGMPFVFLWFAWRKKYSDVLLFSYIPILLTFFQIRFMAMASPWIAMLIVFFLTDVFSILCKNVRWRVVCILSAVLLLTLPYSPTWGFTQKKTHDYFFYPVRAASVFLQDEAKREDLDVGRSGVVGTWDYGHWILFYSGLPVVAHPFQGPLSSRVQAIYGSQNDDELEKFHADIPFRYLMVENAERKFRDALIFSGKNPETFFSSVEGPYGKVVNYAHPEHPFLYQRMLEELGSNDLGDFPDHMRLVYVSHLPSPDNERRPALLVFEYVPGVDLRFASAEDDLTLRIHVAEDQWNRVHVLKKKSKKIGHNMHEWHVPYASYQQGGVTTDGVYEVLDSHERVVHRFHVKESQVLNEAKR